MKNLALIIFILCFLAPPAQSQQRQYNGGIKYTTLRQTEPSPAPQQKVYNTKDNTAETQKIVTEDDSALPKAPSGNTPPKTSEQSVWEKYKELAEGRTTSSEQQNNKPAKPEKPSSPKQAKKEEGANKTIGLGSIIADYQKNKQNRSRIQSMSFAKPKKPTAEKPHVEKPNSAKENE